VVKHDFLFVIYKQKSLNKHHLRHFDLPLLNKEMKYWTLYLRKILIELFVIINIRVLWHKTISIGFELKSLFYEIQN